MHAGERNWMWAWPHGARGGLVWPRWRTAAKPKKQGDRDLRLP
jgi:hypothetical protein